MKQSASEESSRNPLGSIRGPVVEEIDLKTLPDQPFERGDDDVGLVVDGNEGQHSKVIGGGGRWIVTAGEDCDRSSIGTGGIRDGTDEIHLQAARLQRPPQGFATDLDRLFGRLFASAGRPCSFGHDQSGGRMSQAALDPAE
jgi:hypothetical protein